MDDGAGIVIAVERERNVPDRIQWLRGEAEALLSEARALELTEKFAPEHHCPTCEWFRLEIIAEAVRLRYDH